jgi:hypothetical protein
MRISLFKEGAQAHETRLVEQVVEPINQLALANYIKASPWAPGIFEDGLRANKNLQSIDLLVLDIDEGCTLDEAREYFKNYWHIIATTKSHQKEKNGITCDRFRVLLKLIWPAEDDEEFKGFWFAAKAKWPFIDDACKDSARFFYPCVDVISMEDGPAFIDYEDAAFNEMDADVIERTTVVGKRGKLARSTLEFVAEGAPDGTWHSRLFKAAMDFKEQGYTLEEAREQLTKATGQLDLHDEQCIDDVYANREPKYAPRMGMKDLTDWPVVIEGKDGLPKPDLAHPDNYRHLLQTLEYNFSVNELDGFIYINGKLVEDVDYDRIFLETREYGLKLGKDFVMSVMHSMAHENKYHPFKQVVERVPWDKRDHIQELFKTMILEDDGLYTDTERLEFFRRWLVGIIAKVYNPGSQNVVLTFVGEQGIGKSRWLSKLALVPQAFGEGSVDPTNKDHELRHLTNIIWHIPELEYTTGKREAGALKDYLTKEVVAVRPAYARAVRVGKSICSFCASVNSGSFLIDQTGNRRFIVFPLLAIDAEHSVDMQQVFAQARELFKAGYRFWFNFDEIRKVNEANLTYKPDTELEWLARDIEPGTCEYAVMEIFQIWGIQSPTPSQVRELSGIMTKKGIKRRRVSKDKILKYQTNNLRALSLPKFPGSKADN